MFPTWRNRFLISTFLISFILAFTTGLFVEQLSANGKRVSAELVAQGYALRIQEKIQTAVLSTYVLGNLVIQAKGQLTDFETAAAEIIALFPGVSALQLAPDGVIQEIYPATDNEAAIGHNLLSDPSRNREAVEAITRRQVTLAGPFSLIQGGIGAVGRRPIFLMNEQGNTHFWGFANALIQIPLIVEFAGLREMERSGYRYELWRKHPETEQREVFAATNKDIPLDSPAEYVITIYGRHWVLSIAPEKGWGHPFRYLEIVAFSLLFAILITTLQRWGLNSLPAFRGSENST